MTIQCTTCKYLDTKANEEPCNRCGNFNMWETQEYRTVEELEKIKREMIQERDSVDLSCADCFNWNIRLIDKHIAELKGENNANSDL